MSEFDLIRQYFYWPPLVSSSELIVANGDDAAVISVPAHYELAVSVDTSNAGIHFPVDTLPHAIGYKSLAVNLSDMAAMGAMPRWFTLALSLPEKDPAWLAEFSRGLRDLAQQHQVQLIGGDTTRGALSITIQVMGLLPKSRHCLRSHAQVGDIICVTGTLGDAALGLALWQKTARLSESATEYCLQRLQYPSPRLAAREFLLHYAHACMDLSDGLYGDIQHILRASGVGAEINAHRLPYSSALLEWPNAKRQALALSGGDDYELLFTLPVGNLAEMRSYFKHINLAVTEIGLITETENNLVIHGAEDLSQITGFDHFASG